MDDYSPIANSQIAMKMAAYETIHIDHPRMKTAHGIFDYMRDLGSHNGDARKPQRGIRMLAPTQTGKSTAVNSYVAKLGMPPDLKTVLHVNLQQNATPKRLWTDILCAFGDGYAHTGAEEVLKSRAQLFMKRAKVELIVFDEVQQLVGRGGNSIAWNVSEALKRILDEGYAPIVFLGTEEALPIFSANQQFNGRLLSPFDMSPLDSKDPADHNLFKGYCGRLDQQMVELGCITKPSGLMEARTLSILYFVSRGVVGIVSRLICEAMQIAHRRQRSHIVEADISLAIDRWAIPGGFCDHNPYLQATGKLIDRELGI
jgi:predicted AAA+ superfamily ATPase